MSSRTKIVVLHMKEIIYTVLFVAFAVLLLVLLFIMFRSRQGGEAAPTSASVTAQDLYVPGIYSATVALNDTSFDVQVTVDANHINAIELVNISESVETMYPLMQPSLDGIAAQIIDTQSTETIQSTEESKYTSALLLDAIQTALSKASNQTAG